MLKRLLLTKSPAGRPKEDRHNHLLPCVDDGFRSVEASLAAIKRMSDEGWSEFVFTPHINRELFPSTDETLLRKVYSEFSARIPGDWNVKTALAAEYMCVDGLERRVSEDPESFLRYPDGSILVEMSYYFRSKNFETVLFELKQAGITPVIAHPERYPYMADDLAGIEHWCNMGCKLQLNWMSLAGVYGPQSVEILSFLLSQNLYSYVVSDLHSLSQLDRILEVRFPRKLEKYFNNLL